MYCLENGLVVSEISSRDYTQATYQACAEVTYDITIEVFQQEDVELRGVLNKFHAAGIDDRLFILDVRVVVFVDVSRTLEEQAVRHFHDVSFVEDGDFFASAFCREAEGPLSDTCAS